MNLVDLTSELVKSVVIDKDNVGVKEFTTEEPNIILIQVLVSSDDMARLIGKNGVIINSIRTIVQASSYLQENKLVKINVDSI